MVGVLIFVDVWFGFICKSCLLYQNSNTFDLWFSFSQNQVAEIYYEFNRCDQCMHIEKR